MTRVSPRRIAALGLLVLPLVGSACGGGSGGGGSGVKTNAVDAVDNKFEPVTAEIEVGDTVTWTFKGKAAHNVSGPGFRSKTVKTGTFAHTFNSAGTVSYQCTVHPGMTGKVKVS